MHRYDPWHTEGSILTNTRYVAMSWHDGCMSCHKAIVVITGRAHCFHDWIYIGLFSSKKRFCFLAFVTSRHAMIQIVVKDLTFHHLFHGKNISFATFVGFKDMFCKPGICRLKFLTNMLLCWNKKRSKFDQSFRRYSFNIRMSKMKMFEIADGKQSLKALKGPRK